MIILASGCAICTQCKNFPQDWIQYHSSWLFWLCQSAMPASCFLRTASAWYLFMTPKQGPGVRSVRWGPSEGKEFM